MFKRAFTRSLRVFNKKPNVKSGRADEPQNPWEYIPSFTQGLPDELEPITIESLPKHVNFTLAVDGRGLINNAKLISVDFNTNDGRVGIMPGHQMDIMKVTPGVLELKYTGERTEKWFTTGGYAFNSTAGPLLINTHETIKLDDLDLNLVKYELNQARNNLKSRDEKQRLEAFLSIEILEQLEPILESMEE